MITILTAHKIFSEWIDIKLSICKVLLNKFLNSPKVFIMTLVSESLSSWKTWSVPRVSIIFVLMCCSAYNNSQSLWKSFNIINIF